MKLMKKDSTSSVQKAIENIGQFAENLKKQNEEFSDKLAEIGNYVELEFSKPMPIDTYVTIDLREMLDSFRVQHS